MVADGPDARGDYDLAVDFVDGGPKDDDGDGALHNVVTDSA